MKCELCNKEFIKLGNHIQNTHYLNPKDYYDMYVKTEKDGICPECGKPTTFLGVVRGYRKFCSVQCARLNEETQQKYENTCLEKYGNAYPNGFGQDKFKQMMQQKYGQNNVSKIDEFKRKKEQTFLQHFEAKNNFGRQNVMNKALRSSMSDESWKQRRQTMIKNGKRSSYEELFENLLQQSNIEYLNEYKSNVYPWHCDFYLQTQDIYVEINAHWSHGYHLFDEHNLDDLKTLLDWQEKAKTSNFYAQAIHVWTQLDKEKVLTAKNNGLNLVILWNKQDIYNFIKTIVS